MSLVWGSLLEIPVMWTFDCTWTNERIASWPDTKTDIDDVPTLDVPLSCFSSLLRVWLSVWGWIVLLHAGQIKVCLTLDWFAVDTLDLADFKLGAMFVSACLACSNQTGKTKALLHWTQDFRRAFIKRNVNIIRKIIFLLSFWLDSLQRAPYRNQLTTTKT